MQSIVSARMEGMRLLLTFAASTMFALATVTPDFPILMLTTSPPLAPASFKLT